MGTERKLAVETEIAKLLDAGFIREVHYTTWLANVVMVKKPNGKWRMCTDYTNLNKACPKDAYPLLNIDRLVDGASGHGILTFLDAYSGYNQIPMHSRDEEKTAFITDSANYCYQVMPFGLKNAGATYQRLMNKVFQHQIGRNMEVYVDDMVVKSRDLDRHIVDLSEVFQQLRKYDMRLNPEKCVFGVSGGKFLGFMLSARGIEANPNKCMEIINMVSPSLSHSFEFSFCTTPCHHRLLLTSPSHHVSPHKGAIARS
uniref:Transposon Ty3-I Gag-Pol polyprotein n=1 Tax=Cajanus cajan TaxID=3821 RepID=A0A151UBN4_CAJCA|nr:Transposon Ty3-I Gag-Pol polyprotein [Cajanus cajan]